jgi:hypothetical protein
MIDFLKSVGYGILVLLVIALIIALGIFIALLIFPVLLIVVGISIAWFVGELFRHG